MEHRVGHRRRILACAALLAGLMLPAASAAQSQRRGGSHPARHRYPVLYNYPAGVVAGYTVSPTPPGANDWSCRPSPRHPNPVVLVPAEGTMGSDWHAASPLLADHGYCVFALNYGGSSGSSSGGTAPMEQSAVELKAFIQRVLAATHARRVDLVGHSEGGVMPRYYIKFLGGTRTVRRFVALAPLNHGTSLDGIATLAKQVPGAVSLVGKLSAADEEMISGSPFMTNLNSPPEAPRPVRYTVIATGDDEVATPYQTAFLAGPNAKNIVLQAQCGEDQVEHTAISYDSIALHDVLNALDPRHATPPVCKPILPFVGG
jgi:triacylglycerol esterase/lipase EstA (alpha/beta hydrolase family)